MLETQRERLIWARKRAGFNSARAAAIAMGMNEHTYRAYESGYRGEERGLPKDLAERVARFFRVRLSWLLTGEGEPVRGRQGAPAIVVGKIGAGARVIVEDGESGWPVDDIPDEIVETCELYEIEGTSMLPLFHEGDILAIEKRYTSPLRLVGRLALVRLASGERLVKTFKRGPEDVVIESAGRLAWVKFAA